MNEPTRTVERCLPIAAPRNEVYRALLDPAALSRWMYATVQWKPQKGAAYRIDWQDTTLPAHAQGEILEIEENRRLILSWFMERDGIETTASFDLDDDAPGHTMLRFRHSGFPAGPDWQVRFDMVAVEWDKVLENLRFLVEERHGAGNPFYLREQIDLPASRERVYAHWIAPAAITSWLARSAFIDPAPGGEIDLILRDGRRAHGTIRLLVPGKHIRLVLEVDGVRSLIGVSLWPAGEGSTLTVTQRSYAIDESRRAAIRATWGEAFERLRATLERRPGRWPRSGSRTITVERTLPAPPQQVWKAIADAAGLSAWFCDRAEFTPRPGTPYTLLFTGWGEQRGEVLDVDPGARLGLSWDVPGLEGTTSVEMVLSPVKGESARTKLTLTHADWGDGPKWHAEMTACRNGWHAVLAMLEFYLMYGAHGARRSFVLRRRVPVSPAELWRHIENAEAFIAWMGPDARVDPREGGQFHVRSSDGTPLEGRVTMADPDEGIAIEIESGEPRYLDFRWAADGEGSRVLVSGFTYGAAESWPLQQRFLWGERLGRIESQTR